ncbi:MAG: linear amide C-N hydrolase [Lachnospiraceae bacterium]|jgi:penicillin V acylase-like amidase (Ntn superfamily)|nr:linear amide C-N hydrolase [Lachnospiraceae bacterium]
MDMGCSSFSWETMDGTHLLGRTYDQFGDLRANRVIAVPAGVLCAAELGADSEKRPGRYEYTGMAVLGFGEPVVVDGVNGAGLMGALLHYPGYAVYQDERETGKIPVHPGRLLGWLLSQCGGVDEAVRALSSIALTKDTVAGNPLPAHYILSDRSGEAVIVEPDEGGLSIHRQSLGVLANSPDYGWHRTHLRSFVGVTNRPKKPQIVAGHEIREFGERLGGGFGLPGDYSSPSRFVRLAFMKEFAVRGRKELEGVSRMFRAFALVDIPEGLVRDETEPGAYEQTLCTSVMCAESGVYYFAPAWNRRISAVRLLREGSEMRCFDLGEGQDVDYRN